MGGTIDETVPGFIRWIDTGAGRVASLSSEWTTSDRLGAYGVRWGFMRDRYAVPPGLYAIGTPSPADPVVVSANYRLTFDIVRRALAGRSTWLLVLETHGINVWCAAGKGTFGTREVVERVRATRLSEVVSHRRLILPLLSAPGVRARGVTEATGFEARFATVEARDLPVYIDAGMKATDAMRMPTFTLRERMALVPVEVGQSIKTASVPFAIAAIVAGFRHGLPFDTTSALLLFALGLLGILAGTVAVPALLPFLPFRAFSAKGALSGLIAALPVVATTSSWGLPEKAAAIIFVASCASWFALNFTGSTPYTSKSGVKKELRLAIPSLACGLTLALLLAVAGCLR